MPSVRLIRFAKVTVLITGILTVVCTGLIAGWQAIVFLIDGKWQALPLALIVTPKHSGNAVDSTASIGQIDPAPAVDSVNAFLQVPIITILLLAMALLTAFYLWLLGTERRLAKTQIQ